MQKSQNNNLTMDNNSNFFCFYCGKKTETIYKEIRRPCSGKMVTIQNVPLFSCKSCREIFYPFFVISVLNSMSKAELNSARYDFKDLLLIFNNR